MQSIIFFHYPTTEDVIAKLEDNLNIRIQGICLKDSEVVVTNDNGNQMSFGFIDYPDCIEILI